MRACAGAVARSNVSARRAPRAQQACASFLDAVYKCQDGKTRGWTTSCSAEADAYFNCFREHRVRPGPRSVRQWQVRIADAPCNPPQGFVRARLFGIDIDLAPAVSPAAASAGPSS